MEDAYIVAAKRTAIGRFTGGLSSVPATVLGASVIRALLAETLIDAAAVDEVILGQVLTAGEGQNPARQTVLKSGLPNSVPAFTLNKVCGSGQKAIHLAAQAIRAGDAGIVIGGGQENMSRAPHVMGGLRSGVRMGDIAARDTMIVDGLWDATNDVHMGLTAEHLAKRYAITREAQDAFALASQQKALAAIEAGRFAGEIVPIEVVERRQTKTVDTDEHPNSATTAAALSKLRPAFDPAGTVTAGNASGVNDGAAAVMVMSGKAIRALGLSPLARIASYAASGVDPMEMGLGPIGASRTALAKAGWSADELDLIELNEAFAAQSIAVIGEMGWNQERINVNGGAIALGHPIGASGCRIVVTLLHEMIRRDARRGLASLCIGGGMGIAMCLER